MPDSECDYLTQGGLAGVSSGLGRKADTEHEEPCVEHLRQEEAIHRGSLRRAQQNSQRQRLLPLVGDVPGDETGDLGDLFWGQ